MGWGSGTAAYPAAPGVAALAPRFGVYVHIPFCARVCPYCDFNVYAGAEELAPRYVDALLLEAEGRAGEASAPAGSVFVGGGTPSLLDPALVARLLGGLRGEIAVARDAEVTIEANPEDVTEGRARAWRDAGFDRISLGVQSMDGGVLAALGRRHDPAAAAAAVARARAGGFDNVSVDLIFGAPGESGASWARTLREAIALEPDHVSCYSLTIEPGTAFGREVSAGRMAGPVDDEQADKHIEAMDALDAAGYRHYEISNWARPGRESRHNLVYWTQGDYAGLGAGAHSHREGERWWNVRPPAKYIADPGRAREGHETLDARTRADEWLALRLRLVEGFGLAEASARAGRDLGPAAAALVEAGLLERDGDRARLTRRGLLLENEVAARLTR